MAHLKKNYTSQGKRYKVFLSYSGAQNGFVEQLCVDLLRCDRQPFFDKRPECFPIGKGFGSIIFGALEQCQCEVGVVFLSQEYFTSKWPMLELLAMTNVKKRNPNFTILPIYLGISMWECREDHHRKRWLSVWKSWAEDDSRIDVSDLESALRWLGTINGLNYHSEMGEVGFREQIVEDVCKLVPPSTRFEDSYIQGRSRLCKVIHEWIKESKPSSLHGVHVVGLHGVRGIGKTTLCKAMCNDVSEECHRKVAHVELGKQSEEGLLKEVLRRLTDMNLDYLGAMNVDEYHYHLMRDMINFNVFLTIDNVSSATMEQALTLLQANYGHGSVVLVTARSLDELLSMGIDASECMKMPELELEEAESLFLYHAKCVPASYSSNKDDHELISSCVQRCYIKKGDGVPGSYYLPLALQTLGKRLRRVGYHPKQWWLLLDEFDPFGKPQHHIFSTSRRSFASAIIPQDQASISDGYSVSEDYFSQQLEDKTMGPEGGMLRMLPPYSNINTPDVLDAWPTTLPANTRNQQSYQPISHDHDVLLGSPDGALKFTMAELNIITGNFSESCQIGQGGSRSVYRGQLEDGTMVVVKQIKKNGKNVLEIEGTKDFQIAVDTLCKEEHVNLVRVLGFFEDENELILVTEYVTNGNLRQHLDGVPYGVILDMSKRCRISLDVVAALRHIHNQTKDNLDIIHRDIKSLDVLITDDFHAKVAGFGLSQHSLVGDVGASSSSLLVKETSGYMAHEHLTTHHLKEQNDVYSFGELLVEIFTGKRLVESSLLGDECFTPRWVLKQCAEGKLMDIIDPKITPTTFDLKILEQIFTLAASCLVLKESNRPSMECVFWVLSFVMGLYFGDLENGSNSKGDKYDVQEEQAPTEHLDKVDSSSPSFMPTKPHGSLIVESFESNKVQTSIELGTHLEVDSEQASRQASELLVFKQDQTLQLIKLITPDMFQSKSDETYFKMLQEELAKLGYISRLLSQGDECEQNLTNIDKTSFFLYFNENDNVFEFYFKNYQGMASIVGVGLEHAKVVLEDGWRVTVQEIPKSNWDDAWKNFDSSSSTMKVTIPEPLEEGMDNMEDSQEALASIPRGQCLLLDLAQYFILNKAIASFLPRASMMHANTDSGTSSSSSNQDIARSSSSSDEKFSSLLQSVRNIFSSQEASNQLKLKNIDGPPMDPPGGDDVEIDATLHSSSSDRKFSSLVQSMRNIFSSKEASNQLKLETVDGPPMDLPEASNQMKSENVDGPPMDPREVFNQLKSKNVDGPPMDPPEASNQLKSKNVDGPPMDSLGGDDVKTNATVRLTLLPGGDLYDGNVLLDATTFDDELKTLTSQLDNTISVEMTFKFLNRKDEVDEKEIQVIVGPISFQFEEKNKDNFEKNKRCGWYHKSLNVCFGPINIHDSEIGPDHKAIDVFKGKRTITWEASNATTHGTTNSMNVGVTGLAPFLKLFVGGSCGSSTTECVSGNVGKTIEEEFERTRGGFSITSERNQNSSTLMYTYDAPDYMHEFDHGKVPSEDDRKWVLNRHPTFKSQDVRFEGTWLPMDLENNPRENNPRAVEYSLHTSRQVHMTSKEISEMVVKKSLLSRMCGNPKSQKENNEPLKYTQKNPRSIFLNHAMTHLNGETFKVREVLVQQASNQGDPRKTCFKDLSRYAPQWRANPLLRLNSELDFQP